MPAGVQQVKATLGQHPASAVFRYHQAMLINQQPTTVRGSPQSHVSQKSATRHHGTAGLGPIEHCRSSSSSTNGSSSGSRRLGLLCCALGCGLLGWLLACGLGLGCGLLGTALRGLLGGSLGCLGCRLLASAGSLLGGCLLHLQGQSAISMFGTNSMACNGVLEAACCVTSSFRVCTYALVVTSC